MSIERRFARFATRPAVQTRADGSKLIVGYGAVFYRAEDPGTQYELWPGLVERIGPTAFHRALSEQQDVRGLFNHDTSNLLGRTRSTTMRLAMDSIGLRYEIDYADTTIFRDLLVHIERGDVDGSSFGFRSRTRRFEQLDDRSEIMWIDDLDLFDVGPVTYPAYEATSASIRSAAAEACKTEWETWRAQHRQESRSHTADAIDVRMALLRLDD